MWAGDLFYQLSAFSTDKNGHKTAHSLSIAESGATHRTHDRLSVLPTNK